MQDLYYKEGNPPSPKPLISEKARRSNNSFTTGTRKGRSNRYSSDNVPSSLTYSSSSSSYLTPKPSASSHNRSLLGSGSTFETAIEVIDDSDSEDDPTYDNTDFSASSPVTDVVANKTKKLPDSSSLLSPDTIPQQPTAEARDSSTISPPVAKSVKTMKTGKTISVVDLDYDSSSESGDVKRRVDESSRRESHVNGSRKRKKKDITTDEDEDNNNDSDGIQIVDKNKVERQRQRTKKVNKKRRMAAGSMSETSDPGSGVHPICRACAEGAHVKHTCKKKGKGKILSKREPLDLNM